MLYDYSDVYMGMADTIAFIRELLSADPSFNIIPDDSGNREPLEIESDLSGLEYNPIEGKHYDSSVWAIDGGQGTIVRNNVFISAVFRAGYLKFKGRNRTDEMVTPLKLINLTYENYCDIYRQTHLACHSQNPCELPSFSETPGALRRLSEEYVIGSLLYKISEGDIVIMDGSLRDNADGFMTGLMREIKALGANLAGVSKASGILWHGGANLAAVLKDEGDRRIAGGAWCVKAGRAGKDEDGDWISDIYIAKLNKHAPNAFRIDLANCNALSAGEIFSILSAYSCDPFFLGYPYPLAAIHQMVRLTSDELLAFSLRLQDEALKAGIDQGGWNMLFEDYHKVLNFDVMQEPRQR